MGLLKWWRERKKRAAIRQLRDEVVLYIQALEAKAPEMKAEVLRSHVRGLVAMCKSLGFDVESLLPPDSPLQSSLPKLGTDRRFR